MSSIPEFFKGMDPRNLYRDPETRSKALVVVGIAFLVSTIIIAATLANNASKIEAVSGRIRDINLRDLSDEYVPFDEMIEEMREETQALHQLNLLQAKQTTLVGMAVMTGFLGFTSTTAGALGLRRREEVADS